MRVQGVRVNPASYRPEIDKAVRFVSLERFLHCLSRALGSNVPRHNGSHV